MPAIDTTLDSLTPDQRRELTDLDSRIHHLMRVADEQGQRPTLKQLSAELGRDPERVGQRVLKMTEFGLLSHSGDDVDEITEDAVIIYEGDVPTRS